MTEAEAENEINKALAVKYRRTLQEITDRRRDVMYGFQDLQT